MPCLIDMKLGVIDVRDCALAHFRALTVPEAAGQRFVAVHETVSLPQIADWLVKEKDFGKYYDIPTFVLPHFVLSFGSIFSAGVERLRKYAAKSSTYDNQGMIAVLGIKKFRDTSKTLREMVLAMIETEYVPDLRV